MPTFVKAPETTAAALLNGDAPDPQIEAYERVGALIVRDLISPAWIEKLRAAYGDMATQAADPAAGHGVAMARTGRLPTLMRMDFWQDEPVFRDFLFESQIARAAAAAMRSKTAQLYEDLLLTKPAGSEMKTSWHQDAGPWPVAGGMIASVWFCLEDVGPTTGSLRVVEGSHLGPIYNPVGLSDEEVRADAQFWTGGPVPDVDNDERFRVAWTEAAPGDAVIFSPKALHTGYGSSETQGRRTFTIRFIGDDVRWRPRRRYFHAWMRDLPLSEGDKVVTPRLPVLWDAAAREGVL